MNQFESLANWISDQNWGWWPFLALRPPKHKRIDSWLVAKLCVCFSPLYWRLTFAVCWNRRALRLATIRALRPGRE